jgi:glycine hydroxymethyltransferase
LCREALAKDIDKAVFPGLQGGPHNHTTAAKAIAFKEAATPAFREYAHAIVANAKALAEHLQGRGFTLVTGGTDNHLMLVDLTNRGLGGRKVASSLNRAGIELNANSIPFDPRKPFDPSGLRIGLAALTSRGMSTAQMSAVAELIDAGVTASAKHDGEIDDADAASIRARVRELLAPFPAPGL